jgi:spore coat protein A, manganese oxidase
VDFNDPVWLAAQSAAYRRGIPDPVNLVLRNTAPTVDGPPKAKTEGRLMQFRVSATTPDDTSYNPASGIPIRSGTQTIVRLPGAPGGAAIDATTVQATRLLTLNEVMGAGGPLGMFVNNSPWMGMRPDGSAIEGSMLVNGNWLTEFPFEGETEVWEVLNLTVDAHPIHLHAAQFQLVDRQAIDVRAYMRTYDAAFPGGVYIPGYGPPLNYETGNPRALGGNPDPLLRGAPRPPLAHEWGWKDTVVMLPGERTRIVVRWGPQDVPVGEPATFAYEPSAPVTNGEPGVYVWHCHITDHEDNEMMRPFMMVPDADAVRTYIQGVDY